MKNSLLILCFLPSLLFAQPEKVRPGTPLPEFLKLCPTAIRDWDMEREYLKKDTVQGKVAGTMTWSYYNDTIRNFGFISIEAAGPCTQFPKADSTKVHTMRMELEKLRIEFEAALGKPEKGRNVSLTNSGDDQNSYCYLYIWVTPERKSVHLGIRKNVPPENEINAPDGQVEVNSSFYTMEIYVDMHDPYMKSKYGVGSSLREFRTSFPQFRKEIDPEAELPAYIVYDTSLCENAAWTYDFDGAEMFGYAYEADYGRGYGAASDEAAYLAFRKKTEELVRLMNSFYGAPDSMSNGFTPKYIARDRNILYDHEWMYAQWETDSGTVILSMNEIGGGKQPNVVFSISLDWMEE